MIDTTNLTFEFPNVDREAKLRELILHIADKCVDSPKFGMVKLNKIILFSDFYWYKKTGKPITGVGYIRLPYGFVPKRMKPILDQMVANGDIIVKSKALAGRYPQDRVISKEKANLDLFTASQIAWVDEVIRLLWDDDADDVSDLSHWKAWYVYDVNREPIPYESILLSDELVTEDDIHRTEELVKQYGW